MKRRVEMLGARPNVAGGMKRKTPVCRPSVAAANRATTEFLAKRGIAGWARDKWNYRAKTPMSLRPASAYQVRAAKRAAELLSDALTCARVAGCPRLAKAIRFAVGSANGAKRHALRRGVATAYGTNPSSGQERALAQGCGATAGKVGLEIGHFAGKRAFWWKTWPYAWQYV